MSLDAWLTLAVILITIATISTERYPASIVMLAAVVVLYVLGVVDDAEAFAGFGNPAPITVAALYVLAAAAEATGALAPVTDKLLGRPGPRSTERMELARICVPAAASSAFIANTPLVGMLAPRIDEWCRRTGRSASRYLLPLSYATVFGGVITVLGTSTNVTLNGLLRDAGMEPFRIFEVSLVGLAVAGAGVALLVVVAPRLLPVRTAVSQGLGDDREYIAEMTVERGGPLDGTSIAAANLRHLEGVFLVAVRRDDRTLAPVAPDERLLGGDQLVFAGNVRRIVDVQTMRGLRPSAERFLDGHGSMRSFYEAVVGSALAGRTLREADFRNRHGAAVFAIHRAGERVVGKLGDVKLRLGDVLVVLASAGFSERWRERADFLLVSPLGGSAPVRRQKAWIVQLGTAGLVVAASINALDLTQAALVAALAMVATRVLSLREARSSIDFNTVVLIAASFGLGSAAASSGLADVLGRELVGAVAGWGDVWILAGVLVATMVVTELLANNAAAVLMFPIAMATAAAAGLQSRPLVVAVLIGASCSFITPVGYQTNTMVYGMGGYRFGDFTRVGAPLTLATIIVSLLVIPLVFPLR